MLCTDIKDLPVQSEILSCLFPDWSDCKSVLRQIWFLSPTSACSDRVACSTKHAVSRLDAALLLSEALIIMSRVRIYSLTLTVRYIGCPSWTWADLIQLFPFGFGSALALASRFPCQFWCFHGISTQYVLDRPLYTGWVCSWKHCSLSFCLCISLEVALHAFLFH